MTNLIEANKAIFEPIIEHFKDYNKHIHKKNCILFSEPRDDARKFFDNIEVEDTGYIIHTKNYALVVHNQDDQLRKFLILININIADGIEFDNTIISVFSDYRAPFFLLLASQNIIQYKQEELNNFYETRLHSQDDKAFEYMEKNPSVRSHTLEEIENYFSSFTIFEIAQNTDSFNDKNVYRSLLYIISYTSNLIWLPYEKKTIDLHTTISLIGNSNIPYKYILSAFTAIQWKYSFKDLYRCIERLFPIGRISELTESLTCLKNENPFDIAIALENRLKWRSDEKSSLIALLSLVDPSTIDDFCKLLLLCNPSLRPSPWQNHSELLEKKTQDLSCFNTNPTTNAENILSITNEIDRLKKDIMEQKKNLLGSQIYLLRNSFVHYRDNLVQETKEYNFTDSQWNELIQLMLNLIIQIYDKASFK